MGMSAWMLVLCLLCNAMVCGKNTCSHTHERSNDPQSGQKQLPCQKKRMVKRREREVATG